MKISSEVSAGTLQNLFNDMLKTGNFPYDLKLSDITPVFKKKNSLLKVNYRPVNYNLRSQTDFARNYANTNKFGLNSLRYFSSKVWGMFLLEI